MFHLSLFTCKQEQLYSGKENCMFEGCKNFFYFLYYSFKSIVFIWIFLNHGICLKVLRKTAFCDTIQAKRKWQFNDKKILFFLILCPLWNSSFLSWFQTHFSHTENPNLPILTHFLSEHHRLGPGQEGSVFQQFKTKPFSENGEQTSRAFRVQIWSLTSPLATGEDSSRESIILFIFPV